MAEVLEPKRANESDAEFSKRKSIFEAARREAKRNASDDRQSDNLLDKFKRNFDGA